MYLLVTACWYGPQLQVTAACYWQDVSLFKWMLLGVFLLVTRGCTLLINLADITVCFCFLLLLVTDIVTGIICVYL